MAEKSRILSEEDLEEIFGSDQSTMVRRPMKADAEMDITPMIDCVFLLLIFFLVTSTLDQDSSVELPPAQYGQGVSLDSSVIITVANRSNDRPAAVYLGDGTGGQLLPDDPEKQEAAIIEAVKDGFFNQNKSAILIKGAVGVRHKYISRVAVAIGKAGLDKPSIHVAVLESN